MEEHDDVIGSLFKDEWGYVLCLPQHIFFTVQLSNETAIHNTTYPKFAKTNKDSDFVTDIFAPFLSWPPPTEEQMEIIVALNELSE